MTNITRTEVPEAERMAFLPELFTDTIKGRPGCTYGEAATYRMAERLCRLYAGGQWRFYRLSNGSGYLAPDIDAETLPVAWPGNYFEGDMSPDALGITATIFALTICAETVREHNEDAENELSMRLYRLKEYAAQHPESAAIGRAID